MNTGNIQKLQEEEYWFPYHYVSQFKGGFTQCFNDTWGINYVATIEFLLSKLESEDFDSIVDVGCGDGRFTRELFNKFYQKKVVGIDYSEKAILLAKAMNYDCKLEFLNCDITQQKNKEKYDICLLIEVFEHIPPNMADQFIKSVAGLISKNGLLYITVPHINKPVEYKHFRHFSVQTLSESLNRYFEIIEVVPFEKKSKRKTIIDKILTNSIFILNNPHLKNIIYTWYKQNLFFVSDESKCQRVFLKAKRI